MFLENFVFLSQHHIWGNSIDKYLYVVLSLIVLFFVFKLLAFIINKILLKVARKTSTDYDDIIIEIISAVKPAFYIYLAIFVSVKYFLIISEPIQKFLTVLLWVWLVYYLIVAGQKLIVFLTKKFLVLEDDDDSKTAANAISIIAKIVLWSFGLLLILSNLGVDITSLIAGLGVGGIAIAFALQNILSDLFASFSIYFDKPFKVGDAIMVEGQIGVVQKIGIKTTRIKALQGEEIVISNNKLTSATIQNFKKLQERRVVFEIGVTYDTPQEKLEKVPSMIKEIIEKTDNARFDRSHFKAFGDFALLFETVYYAETSDYIEYMNANQNILLEIRKAFEKDKIEFAFPTQTIHLEK